MNLTQSSLTAEFSVTADSSATLVPYEGKIFEAGKYPDKDFAITDSELAERVQCFHGLDLDLEHSSFKDLLGNKLGRLEAIWNRGSEAFGRLMVPQWLHKLAGGKLKTSLSFDQDKNIVGCALTLSPRIADAQVVAAFSRAETALPTPPIKEKKPMPTSLKDRLRILFGSAPDATQQAGIDPTELETIEFKVAEPRLDPTIESQLAEFRATNDRLVSGQLNLAATLFADETIRSAKAVPAQRDHLIALFRSSALADGQGTVRFNDLGQITDGPNITALRNLFQDAQPHRLFSTEIPNQDPHSGGSEPDPAVVERLRKATGLGQKTLKKEAN